MSEQHIKHGPTTVALGTSHVFPRNCDIDVHTHGREFKADARYFAATPENGEGFVSVEYQTGELPHEAPEDQRNYARPHTTVSAYMPVEHARELYKALNALKNAGKL